MLRFRQGALLSNVFSLMAHRLCPCRGDQIEIKIKILRRSRSNSILPRSHIFTLEHTRGIFIGEVRTWGSRRGTLGCRTPSPAACSHPEPFHLPAHRPTLRSNRNSRMQPSISRILPAFFARRSVAALLTSGRSQVTCDTTWSCTGGSFANMYDLLPTRRWWRRD